MTTDKATLLKSNYSCCEHPCDVVTDSIALITTIDSGNWDSRDTALVVCCPTKREVFPTWRRVTDEESLIDTAIDVYSLSDYAQNTIICIIFILDNLIISSF